MEGDLRMVVGACHLDEAWALSSHPDGLVRSQGSNNQLGDSVEDSSLPIHIIWAHFFAGLPTA